MPGGVQSGARRRSAIAAGVASPVYGGAAVVAEQGGGEDVVLAPRAAARTRSHVRGVSVTPWSRTSGSPVMAAQAARRVA